VKKTRTPERTDVLVLGSGIAGLFLALRLAEKARVVVATKKRDYDSNTNYAQGGIAAVLGPGDRFALHVRDTLVAGAGLCHPDVVRAVVSEGPDRVRDLMELGVRFSRGARGLSLGREGGHSARRIAHAADLTGRAIEQALLAAVLDHPRIRLLENHMAVDLIRERGGRRRVWGAEILDRSRGRTRDFLARAVVLATGGSGKVYLYTSNPDVATGDGVAMAYRVGARVANMEFFQFPTCLYHPRAQGFLITEAVRGESAKLPDRGRAPLHEGSPSARQLAATSWRAPSTPR
jgi:L-aspartate oxidase